MKVIFLFPSIHFVLKAEKAFKASGFKPDLVPVPKEISSDCGMAIELDFKDLNRAQKALKGLEPEAIYLRAPEGFKKLLDS